MDPNRSSMSASPTARSSSPTVRFQDPRAESAEKPKAVLTTLTLLGVIYTASISGGYGLEDSIAAGGPLLTIMFLMGIPFVWGIPVSLCVAELSCAIPSNAGPIMWVNCTFPSWLTFATVQWTAIFNIIDNSLYPTVFADYCATLFSISAFTKAMIKVIFLLFCAVVNIFGVELVGSFSVGVMIITIMPFFLMFSLQLYQGLDWDRIAEVPSEVNWALFLPVVAWNFSGFDSSGNVIEEVQDPHSTFIRALLLMIGAALVTYVPPILAGASAEGLKDIPFSEWGDGYWVKVGEAIGGRPMASIILLGGTISTVGLMITLLATTSRSLAGMGSINAFPRMISQWISVYDSNGTPTRATIVNTLFTAFLAISLTFQSLVMIDQVLYALRLLLILSCFLKLRLTQPFLIRPYSAPGGIVAAFVWAGVPIAFSLYLMIMIMKGGGLGLLLSSITAIFGVALISYVTIQYFRPEGFEGRLVEEYEDADTQVYGTILERESKEWRECHPPNHFVEIPTSAIFFERNE